VKLKNHLRTLGVGVVTAVAAIGSYAHMRALALQHGQGAHLSGILPLSVDGLLIVASLEMAGDREAGRRPRFITRTSFLVGVAASVIANVLAAPDDVLSRSISAWPAVGLLLVVEMITGKRKAGAVPGAPDNERSSGNQRSLVTGSVPDPGDIQGTLNIDRASPLVADVPQDAGNLPAAWITAGSNSERVKLAAARLPATASLAEIAAAAGCSERTAGRYLADDHPAKPGNGRTPGAGNGRQVVKPATT
jgi:hypothetical protein